MSKKNLHILMAEDDSALRRLTEFALTKLGYIVETAANGKEAFAPYEQKSNGFDALIMDPSMTLMTGLELVESLRKNGFEDKIVVTSGSLTPLLEETYPAKRTDKIIQKPFTMDLLAYSLDKLFNRFANEKK